MAEKTSPWAELTLEDRHVDELKRSDIKPEVALARGYITVTKVAQLSKFGFKPSQCIVPGILMPVYGVTGEIVGYQYKPDQPRMTTKSGKTKTVKYETPGGSTTAPDVPRPARQWVVDPQWPLFITEGLKKADSAASHELAVLAYPGVWNWRTPEALATLDQIPWKGRTVYLLFDSDWRRKSDVKLALMRLAAVLHLRGAVVYVINLPESHVGQKVGVDDFFAAGGTTIELLNYAERVESTEDVEDLTRPEKSGPQTVTDVLPNAPCSSDALIPEEWELSETGIRSRKITTVETLILPTAAIVTERLVDRASGDESIKLAFLDQHRWKVITVKRDVIATASKVVTLALSGLPVTSNTAAEFVRYAGDYMAINAAALPVTVTSSVLGWQGDAGFLLPDRLIQAKGGDATIIFAASDSGSAAHANALKSSGTLEGWLGAMKPLAEFERVRFMVHASFAAPLLEVLNSPGFVGDLAGPTSGGKTTTLRCAGSVWGQSDPSQPCSIVSTFQSTRVYRERVSALFNSVPVVIDDTMMAKNPADVQSFLYDVVGGQGRGRGSLTGIQTTTNWRTVALISGENSATGMTDAGGTKARVLTIYGRPFGAGANVHVVISEVMAGIADNHGHAGPAFVAWLLKHKAKWSEWRQLYREHTRSIAERAGGGPVINRVSSYIAAVEMASVLASEAGLLPWEYADISPTLLHELAGEARGADVAADALLEVLSWAAGRADSFFSTASEDDQPIGGWLGRWDRGFEGGWQTIGIASDHLRKALEANGHKDITGIIRQWHERGWLEIDTGDDQARRMKRLRIGSGVRMWAYVIKQNAEKEARASLNGGQ